MPPTKNPPCPICGKVLQAVVLDADTPPWLCEDDARGFWPSEITHAGSWRAAEHDFGPDTQMVMEAARADHANARAEAAKKKGN